MHKTLAQIEAEWKAKYPNGRTREEAHAETQAALAELKKLGIEPTMSAEELMKLTRGRE